ncbi:UMF1 family MFS transporter [Microbacterium halimionae]|uniref:UMF1 family MFS transporter n=2 Tax=Microbacterium halimionae TaxID=1526413 RepID=A0A7W3JQ82_9MICO|nr:UMF1 family MFS transporter [Microbacterium halimionae]NII94493.1 UMF1 family MFS transporter [Microbacterium halimionae]
MNDHKPSRANSRTAASPPAASTGALLGMAAQSDDSAQNRVIPRGQVVSWALWDWGSAAFNAVVTTFVFSTFLASELFVDPAIVAAADGDAKDPALVAALADNASTIGWALAIAGVLIAILAPVLGQRSDGTGRRKLWLGINTGAVVLAMLAMFFVDGAPGYLILGATLLAVGNIFFEFAGVNYNAMLVQVSTRKNMGRVSGFGWGMGYVGGIVLLIVLLALFVQGFGTEGEAGLLGISTEGGLHVRMAVVASAIWFAIFAIPVLVKVPEIPARDVQVRVGFFRSYAVLAKTISKLWHSNRQVLMFLLASAVFRDGLAGVFTFGAIIAAQVFGFSSTEVLYFAVAANVVAGISTIIAGRLDDSFGPKRVIIVSLAGLVIAGSAVLFIGTAQVGFWIAGLVLTGFVGPVQSASRSFLARITPPGREGEIFGLYATSGRAVSFLAPSLFALFVALTGDTRLGILGLVIVLLAGLVLMLPVKEKQVAID